MIALQVLYFNLLCSCETPQVLKNFYDVIVFASSFFALLLKGSSFLEFCNLSKILNSTFFYQMVLKGTGWPDSIFSFISTTVKKAFGPEIEI